MPGTDERTGWAWLAAALTMVLWATSFLVIRVAVDHFSPGAMTLLRVLAAFAAMTVIVLVRRPRLPRSLRSILFAVGWGIAWFTVYSIALSAAEVVLDPATAAMVVNSAPLIVALIAGLAFGEGLPARLLVGIGVAFAGVVLIAVAGFTGKFSVVGLVLAVVAAALYAACVLVQKRYLQGEDPIGVTWVGILAGLLVAAPWTPELVGQIAVAPPSATWGVVYMGVFPTAIAFTFWGYALKRIPAGRLSASSLVVPAIVLVLAWVLLGELPPALAAVGGVVCMAGAAIAIVPDIVAARRAVPAGAQPVDISVATRESGLEEHHR